ncbi:MAG: hypothetical protein LBK61_13820 [Spirochaetaceae bacterium]|nr:hypothetical protein [Spirochaetaceae bacterium]
MVTLITERMFWKMRGLRGDICGDSLRAVCEAIGLEECGGSASWKTRELCPLGGGCPRPALGLRRTSFAAYLARNPPIRAAF